MKTTHIIALLVIASAVGYILFSSSDFSTYETFKTAAEADKIHHVVGTLVKDKPMEYDPQTDPNHFAFFMQDKNGEIQKVVFNGAKPQDFERSEQIVLTGRMGEQNFEAQKILMKCPSKYNKDELLVEEVKATL